MKCSTLSKQQTKKKKNSEKPRKQKLARDWQDHNIITRDLKTIEIDTKKCYYYEKHRQLQQRGIVDRAMAKTLIKYLPEDGDAEVELSQDRN